MKHIIVIEDERSIADTVVHCVEREGFPAEWHCLGHTALERIREGNGDHVVLDVELPDVSDFELYKHIRAFSMVLIIFLTARDDEIDTIVGLEIGADDYVTKPFSPRELGARLRTVLRRGPAASPPSLPAVPAADAADGNAEDQIAPPGLSPTDARPARAAFAVDLVKITARYKGRPWISPAMNSACSRSSRPAPAVFFPRRAHERGLGKRQPQPRPDGGCACQVLAGQVQGC